MTDQTDGPEMSTSAIDPPHESREVRVPPGPPQLTSGAKQSRAADNEISEELLEPLLHTHDYVNEYVRFADQKAAFIVTLVSAMLAYLHARNLLPALAVEFSLMGVLRFLAPLGLVLSAGLAIGVVFPARDGKINGLVFWGAIASRGTAASYRSDLTSVKASQFTADLASHIHEVSVICRRKYERLAWAMMAGAPGLLASILLILGS